MKQKLIEWWNFYKMIRVLKKMVREQSTQAQKRQLSSSIEYTWAKAGLHFMVKEYKDGDVFYGISTPRGELIFEAMDKGWLRGTSGKMEAGLTPDVLIMRMLSQ